METLNVRPRDVEPVVHRAMQVNFNSIWGAPVLVNHELIQGIPR